MTLDEIIEDLVRDGTCTFCSEGQIDTVWTMKDGWVECHSTLSPAIIGMHSDSHNILSKSLAHCMKTTICLECPLHKKYYDR